MTPADLRALSEKWRRLAALERESAANTPTDTPARLCLESAHCYSTCADELDAIRAQLAGEAGEAVAFAVVDADGNVGKLGWMPMAEYGRWTDYIKPREGWHIEYAYRAALPAQPNEERK